MSLEPGTEVQHPQWGRGTVLFDKPHCIGIKFIMHGQVNFSQEEWQAQHSPSHRFHSISDLEYSLDRALENGLLSETQASDMLTRRVHALEVRKLRLPTIETLEASYKAYVSGQLHEDDFYKDLLVFITKIVKKHSPDRSTFSNLEDVISESALEVWRCLKKYDANVGSFSTFVGLIVARNIQDLFKQYRLSRGEAEHIQLDEEHIRPSRGLNPEQRLLFDEWLRNLDPTDRAIMQMLRDGLIQEEIGQALNITQQGVAWRVARIRQEEKPPF